MEAKDPAKESVKNNPIKNFCWPLSGKEKEECIQSYEDALEEEGGEKEQEEDESRYPPAWSDIRGLLIIGER